MNEFSKPFGLKKGAKKMSNGPPKAEDRPIPGKKMPKWKMQSLQFRQAMMSANGAPTTTTTAEGGFRPTQE